MELKKNLLYLTAMVVFLPTSLLANYDNNSYYYPTNYDTYNSYSDGNYNNGYNSFYSSDYRSKYSTESLYYLNDYSNYSPYDYYGLIQPSTYENYDNSSYGMKNYDYGNDSTNYDYPTVNCAPDYKYSGDYSNYHSYADDEYYRDYYNYYTDQGNGDGYPNYYFGESKNNSMPVVVIVFINQANPHQHFSMRNHQPENNTIPVIKVVLDSSYYDNLANSLNQNPNSVVININLGTGMVGHDYNGSYSSGYYGDAWVN